MLKLDRGRVNSSCITAEDGQNVIVHGDREFTSRINEIDILDLSTLSLVLPLIDGTQTILYITAQIKKKVS